MLPSINPQEMELVTLMFHSGRKNRVDFPFLLRPGDPCKYMRVESMDELYRIAPELIRTIKAWCAWKE